MIQLRKQGCEEQQLVFNTKLKLLNRLRILL